ncbi:Lysophospholipase L1 [Polaribacter sp. Hel1_33_78]|uniref:GDSL-type esterase/lipase family protein n=1 Tax=Polaribacter sp. Hel1_33_78 TaxID=1336804 RepID=UPI00087D0A4A|nr:GDSL-type esterase/lipase family protein [Polaribacter sp. Hel1_33_78]SDT96305.1 Lysophospholipase L1 [Polaribacter sp. Hel1_33_78]
MKNYILKPSFIFLLILSLNSCSQNNEENIIEVEEVVIPDNLYPLDDIVISNHTNWTKTHYPKRIAEFKANPLETGDIVFIGNSITEQGEDWASKVDNSKAKNRGIAGDTTEGILARLNEITFYKPEKVFLLIGINDLFHNPDAVEKIHENILKIVAEINTKSPNTQIFVQTVLPTTTDNLIPKIKDLNAALENSSFEKPFTFINLHQRFVLLNGKMNMDFSTDGVHLNEKGYEIWSEMIKNSI